MVGGLGFRARGFVVSRLGCSGGGIDIHKWVLGLGV